MSIFHNFNCVNCNANICIDFSLELLFCGSAVMFVDKFVQYDNVEYVT